jgi:uridine kinase
MAGRLAAASREAGLETVILGVDDFRRPVDWQRPDRAEARTYYDDYYDLTLLSSCLAAFLDGATAVDIPVFDSTSEQLLAAPRRVSFGDATVALVEGVFARRVAMVSKGAALVYLRTSFPEARRRIVARDMARGRSLAEVSHRIEARYFPAQERYLRDFDPIAHADVLIDNEQFTRPAIIRFHTDRFPARTAQVLSRAFGHFASPTPVE